MKILIVCLTPALQHTLWLDGFEQNKVNRAGRFEISAGGKGINIARNLVQLDKPSELLTMLGGHTGEAVKECFKKDKITFQHVSCENDTRVCMTLLDRDKTQTEIVEESPEVHHTEVRNTEQYYKSLLPQSELVILSGTVPPGFSDMIYKTLSALAVKRNIPVMIDGSGSLLRYALSSHPFLVKPNKEELQKTLGEKIDSKDALLKATRQLVKEGAQNVLVTDGSPVAWLLTTNDFYKITAPSLEVVNPIGSGDAIAAGIALKQVLGETLISSVKFGMACGAANVLTELAGNIRIHDVEEIYKKIGITAHTK